MRDVASGFLAGLAALGLGAMAAGAQERAPSVSAELRPLPVEPPLPLATFGTAQAGFGRMAAPLPPGFQPFGRAKARTETPGPPSASLTVEAAPASPPPGPAPRLPSRLGLGPSAASVAAPEVKPELQPAAAAVPALLGEREIVAKANAFFTNLTSLVAEFTQVGGDGRRQRGTIFLQRPGKVHFAYDKPATLEVIADGTSVAVRDVKLGTQDLFPLSQTPLKFLLGERVNLGQDIKITGIANEGDAVRLSLEDRSTLGGTSRIDLFFDSTVENLTEWRIVDPQGFQTSVTLDKVDRTRRIDQRLFVINVNTAINTDNASR